MSGRPSWYYGDHPPACTCSECLDPSNRSRKNIWKILVWVDVAVLAVFAIWRYRKMNRGSTQNKSKNPAHSSDSRRPKSYETTAPAIKIMALGFFWESICRRLQGLRWRLCRFGLQS